MNTGGSNMLATELRSFISPMVRAVVSTGAVTEARITRDYGRKDEAFQRWEALIDDPLIEWGRDPSQLENEEIQPPSKSTIQLAIRLAVMLSKPGFPAPTRIVADADGGIVFERQERNLFESIRLSADGSAEYCAFINARMVEREFVPPPSE